MSSNPAVVPDDHRAPILDVVPAALHLRLVGRGKDTHIWPDHDAVADGDQAAVEDGEVEVSVEAGAEGDVAAVVDCEGRLDEGVGADVAEEGAQAREALVGEGVEGRRRRRVREVRVVFVRPGTRLEAGGRQARLHRVVAGGRVSFACLLAWAGGRAARRRGEVR